MNTRKVGSCTQPNPPLPDCSRFWECGPAGESCLVECARCPCLGLPEDNCDWQCEGENGYQWALTFDEK